MGTPPPPPGGGYPPPPGSDFTPPPGGDFIPPPATIPPPGTIPPPPGGMYPPPPPGNWGGYGGYGPPPPGYGAPLTKGLAVASLVLGIIGILTSWFGLGGILGIIGLVLGLVAIGKARKGKAGGKGVAIAGTVLSGLAIALTIVFIAVYIAAFGPRISQYRRCMHNAHTQPERQACSDQLGNSFLSPTPSP
jgi:hypothetical protein